MCDYVPMILCGEFKLTHYPGIAPASIPDNCCYLCRQMTPVKIKIINHSANPLPEYATAGSSGMDIRAHLDQPLTLASLQRSLVPTGLFIELPAGYEAQIRPRSGLAIKQGITCLNSPGTIDS